MLESSSLKIYMFVDAFFYDYQMVESNYQFINDIKG